MKRNLVYRIAVLTIIFSFVWTSRAFEKDSNERNKNAYFVETYKIPSFFYFIIASAISLSAPKLDVIQ